MVQDRPDRQTQKTGVTFPQRKSLMREHQKQIVIYWLAVVFLATRCYQILQAGPLKDQKKKRFFLKFLTGDGGTESGGVASVVSPC